MSKTRVRYILISALNVDRERRPIIDEETVGAPDWVPEVIEKIAFARLKSGECQATQMVVLAIPLSEEEPAGWFRPQPREEITGVDFVRLV